MNPSNNVQEVKTKFEDFQKICAEILPKVDQKLIIDLIPQQQKEPKITPLYTVEVFTDKSVDPEFARQYIIGYTGMAPATFDKGRHFVTNQRLTLDTLKMISDKPNVLEIKGSYTGSFASGGASHERGEQSGLH